MSCTKLFTNKRTKENHQPQSDVPDVAHLLLALISFHINPLLRGCSIKFQLMYTPISTATARSSIYIDIFVLEISSLSASKWWSFLRYIYTYYKLYISIRNIEISPRWREWRSVKLLISISHGRACCFAWLKTRSRPFIYTAQVLLIIYIANIY